MASTGFWIEWVIALTHLSTTCSINAPVISCCATFNKKSLLEIHNTWRTLSNTRNSKLCSLYCTLIGSKKWQPENSFEANSWNARTFDAWLGFWADTSCCCVRLNALRFDGKWSNWSPLDSDSIVECSKEQRPQFWKWVSLKLLASYVITESLSECFCATETTNFQFTV